MTDIDDHIQDIIAAKVDEIARLRAENERLRSALKFMIEEITDLEGREGMTDYDFAEQVIALAQEQRGLLHDEQSARKSEYRKVGIDPNNPNPDGSDYHLMNIIDEQSQGCRNVVHGHCCGNPAACIGPR